MLRGHRLTDGELLRGVRYERNGARTQSLVMRSKSGTVRMIDARHRIDKLSAFAASTTLILSLDFLESQPRLHEAGDAPCQTAWSHARAATIDL